MQNKVGTHQQSYTTEFEKEEQCVGQKEQPFFLINSTTAAMNLKLKHHVMLIHCHFMTSSS